MIKLVNVSKGYQLGKTKVTGVENVNLKIGEGEFLALAGPSGSGKTTLLNLLGCLDTPDQGEIIINGREITGLSSKKKTKFRQQKIGFIFQDFNLLPVLSVFENVEYPLLLEGMARKHRKEAVDRVLEEVGLLERRHHYPGELSGGERQRVSIARALVKNPDIILADEPTANLDSVTGEKIITLMSRLNRLDKITFVFSSHDQQVLDEARRIIQIKDGRLDSDLM